MAGATSKSALSNLGTCRIQQLSVLSEPGFVSIFLDKEGRNS